MMGAKTQAVDGEDDLRLLQARMRWLVEELMRAYERGDIDLTQLAKSMVGAAKALTMAAMAAVEADAKRRGVITPQRFVAIMEALGTIVQSSVSDPKERALIVKRFTQFLRNEQLSIAASKYLTDGAD